ncbi:hypothetical protein [Parachryseolinea silvisoli]|uniref:hypothetical protein n=1 Tax=Parachryseolinea silvisoli TaxID=2873601 RepID=UPI002265EE79|nr:hypothetical protein [Parachryseolinea silvisoli]MCD9019151.1 hypothetical protein [Parachryseolinea silvisoli]
MNEPKSQSTYDLEGRLRVYFPALFNLLNEKKLDWRSITRTFERKMADHTKRYKAKGVPVLVEVSFYGYVVAYSKGIKEAESFLQFINDLFESLNGRLTDKEKLLIRDNINGIFSNMDLKFLNFVGELAVLNYIKANTNCELDATECLLDPLNSKGSRIDFRLVVPSTMQEQLMEVVNIMMHKASTWSESQVKNRIYQKITEKLRLKGLSKERNFMLVPVIWGSYEDIKAVMSHYKAEQPVFQNTSIPFGYVAFRNSEGEAQLFFGPISAVLKKVQ